MAAADNQQIQDPSTQGTGGLRGLDGINRLRERGINIDTSILGLARDYRGTMQEINRTATPRQDIGFVGVNDSMFEILPQLHNLITWLIQEGNYSLGMHRLVQVWLRV